MKFFDLFAGIGGFRVGLEAHGHECVGSCEIDKYARKIYGKNFGHEPEYKDVRDIDPKDIQDFDILCAGFPCQSFSIVGNRMGFEDKRGNLFFEIIRLAKEKRPSILLLENVKGLLSHEKGETFRIMLQTLDECGYDVSWQLLNSRYFVPQSRERVYIIANLRGSSGRKILPLGKVSKRNDKSRKELYAKDECSSTLTATYWKGYGGGRPMIKESKPVQMNYRANTNSNMKERVQDRDETWTLTTNSNDFTITDGDRVRKLTPTECERLQGFADGWTKGISDTQRWKCLGNAVTTNVVEYIVGHWNDDDLTQVESE
jgi:DNA (cytosine-5)-methyltransferase 1